MTGWYARDIDSVWVEQVQVGDLLAYDHVAWRVTHIADEGEEYRIAAVKEHPADPRPHTMRIGKRRLLQKLRDHYSVCVRCGEIQPCREQTATRVAAEVVKHAARFEVEGFCPACREPVTARQASVSWAENVMTPLGPPVTFHRRQKCFRSAVTYDQAWAKALNRDPQLEESLSCDGSLYRHRDGVTTCTSIDCPSARARHQYWAQCYTRSHGCPRFECQFQGATA